MSPTHKSLIVHHTSSCCSTKEFGTICQWRWTVRCLITLDNFHGHFGGPQQTWYIELLGHVYVSLPFKALTKWWIGRLATCYIEPLVFAFSICVGISTHFVDSIFHLYGLFWVPPPMARLLKQWINRMGVAPWFANPTSYPRWPPIDPGSISFHMGVSSPRMCDSSLSMRVGVFSSSALSPRAGALMGPTPSPFAEKKEKKWIKCMMSWSATYVILGLSFSLLA